MEEAQERKKRFVVLLEELLKQCEGVKGKLAEELKIKSPRLTHWLQGKIDPASLDATAFIHLAKQKEISVNELATLLGISFEPAENSLEKKFKSLIEQLLFNKSQEELAARLGIKRSAISSWITQTRPIDPAKISIATMAAIAFEKGWTLERLFIYLGLKDIENAQDLRFKLKSIATTLSLVEQIDLLAWLSTIVGRTVKDSSLIWEGIKNKNNRTLCIILEQDDVALASAYFTNFAKYLQLQPENIKIATPHSIPDSLEDFDILILDINSPQSPCIPLVESLEFEGDILVFADSSLPDDVRELLEQKATEVIVKPVPWSTLKDKSYFLE